MTRHFQAKSRHGAWDIDPNLQKERCTIQVIDKPAFQFVKRSSQPPMDRTNSLLSFLYTLLLYNVYSLIEAQGLNPFVGILNGEMKDRPALALDMIEEFRCFMESVALDLIRGKTIREKDFAHNGEAHVPFVLTEAGRAKAIQAFENAMRIEVIHKNTGHRLSVRRCIEGQANLLLQAIMSERPSYVPYAFSDSI